MIAALLAVPVGLLALAVLVVDETDEVFANLYSAGVSLKNAAPRLPGRRVAVALGAVATLAAVLVDDLARYENFLFLLGALFVPLFGVLAADWYVLARRRYDVEAMYRADGPYRGVRWPAVAGLAAGVPGLQLDQPGDGDGLGVAGRAPVRRPAGPALPAVGPPALARRLHPRVRCRLPGYAGGRSPLQEGDSRMTTTTFAGMPDAGLAFLEDLEERNTKEFFDANRGVFKEQVQAPFAALVEAAAARLRRTVPGLGQPKVFRIYRDLRFSKDKTPYKTSMSASVPSRPAEEGDGPGVGTGFYVNVGPAGLYTASGLYHPGRPELERVRAAVADPATGPELEAVLAQGRRQGPGAVPGPPPAHAQALDGRPPEGRPAQGPLPGPQPPARPRPLAPTARAARPPARRLEGDDPLQPLAGTGSLSAGDAPLRPGGGRRTPAGRPGRGRGS